MDLEPAIPDRAARSIATGRTVKSPTATSSAWAINPLRIDALPDNPGSASCPFASSNVASKTTRRATSTSF